ncbi:MAG: restriction endonuclease subunit S, partial [Bacilli bacterium]
MSRIDDLINEKCSNGVEYKKLYEVTIWDKKFNNIDKHMQNITIKYNYLLANQLSEIEDINGDVLILNTGINAEVKYTNKDLASDNLHNGEIVCIPGGGTPNVKYYKGYFVTGDNRIATSYNCHMLSNKFLYYFLNNNLELISSFYRGSGIKHPEMKKILMMNIPIPPIEVQEEIVKILDKFSELEAELEAE